MLFENLALNGNLECFQDCVNEHTVVLFLCLLKKKNINEELEQKKSFIYPFKRIV